MMSPKTKYIKQVDVLHEAAVLDLAVLHEAAQLGHGHPLLLVALGAAASTPCVTSPSVPAALASAPEACTLSSALRHAPT